MNRRYDPYKADATARKHMQQALKHLDAAIRAYGNDPINDYLAGRLSDIACSIAAIIPYHE